MILGDFKVSVVVSLFVGVTSNERYYLPLSVQTDMFRRVMYLLYKLSLLHRFKLRTEKRSRSMAESLEWDIDEKIQSTCFFYTVFVFLQLFSYPPASRVPPILTH